MTYSRCPWGRTWYVMAAKRIVPPVVLYAAVLSDLAHHKPQGGEDNIVCKAALSSASRPIGEYQV